MYDKREKFYIHLIREECKIFYNNYDKILFLHLIRTNYDIFNMIRSTYIFMIF